MTRKILLLLGYIVIVFAFPHGHHHHGRHHHGHHLHGHHPHGHHPHGHPLHGHHPPRHHPHGHHPPGHYPPGHHPPRYHDHGKYQLICGDTNYPVGHPMHNHPPGHRWHRPHLCKPVEEKPAITTHDTNCGEKSYPVGHPLHNHPPGHPWHKPELCSKTTTTTIRPITTIIPWEPIRQTNTTPEPTTTTTKSTTTKPTTTIEPTTTIVAEKLENIIEEDKTLPKPNTKKELEALLSGPLSFLGQNTKNYILGKSSDLEQIKKELNRSFVNEILKYNNRKQQEELKKLKDKIMYLIQEDLKDSIDLQNLATSGKLSKILPGASEYILGKKLTAPELKKLKEKVDENIDEAIVDYFGDDRKTDLTPEQLSKLRKELNKKIDDDITNFKTVLTEEEEILWLTNILSSGKYDHIIPNELKDIIMGIEYPTPSRLEELIQQIRKIPDIDNEVKTMKIIGQKMLQNMSENLNKWQLDYYNKILNNFGQPNQPKVPVYPDSAGSNEYGLVFPMGGYPNQISTIAENELKDMVQTFDPNSSDPLDFSKIKTAKLCCTEE